MALDFSQPFTERTPRIVNAAKLHRAAARRKANAFLAEGENAVEAAVATGAATDLFVTERAAQRFAEILTTAEYMNVYTHAITEKAAEHLSDTVSTTGIFALCKPVTWPVKQALKGYNDFWAVGVETSDPGNAGTLIRIADAMGADGVIFAGETVDPQSPKVVRSTAGSLFHVPVARDKDTKAVISQLKDKGLKIIATVVDGDVALDYTGEILAQPHAWLFGNEAHGLDPELAALADYTVTIPIQGSAESLNLASAAAMCLWESSKAQYVVDERGNESE
ncbi:TrmH family RNA methyltransferase [Corynebacterium cystitidis]|uniref:TrmH family RNA methyltransferase n=1 Tax=Corynebacterium cystitidis TaxID=35757 RepID=UPI00211E7B55|nr:RNA methyltransferase [Corynebacterium cystitidis]